MSVSANPFWQSPPASTDFQKVAKLGYGLVIFAIGFFGAWASLANVDSAVIAPGTVSVEGKRKVVQHLEGGIVAEVAVRDGQKVEQGQVLLRLDSTASRAGFDAVRKQLDASLAQEARLVAERDELPEVVLPQELTSRRSDPAVDEVIKDQLAVFRDRRGSLVAQIEILEGRNRQIEVEISGLQRERESAEKQLYFVDDELAGVRLLTEKGLVAKPRHAALEREKARLQGLVGRNMADAAKAENAMGETTLQIRQLKQKVQEDIGAALVDVRQKIGELRERLVVATNVLNRIDIRAPRAGVVQNTNPRVYTVGAVVRPGDTLLEIVPNEDELMVEAQVPVSDIDRLHAGASVEVRFPAFHSRTTPLVVAHLQSLSRDRLVDEVTRQPYFQALVAVSDADLPEGLRTRLRPGMPAEVVFKTGERSVLSYLVRPLGESLTHSFNEK